MNKKALLGQFNTTRKDYILNGFEQYVPGKTWVDPYAGDGDLLEWATAHGANKIEGFDIDPAKVSNTVQLRDTLMNPPDYSGKFIIANPPYLARNKCKDKTLYDKYDQDDLYKISILTSQGCEGGIFIIPLNFLSSVYANSIRDLFFQNYRILSCRIFEESVFDDTDYTVCAFYFEKANARSTDAVKTIFLPTQLQKDFSISKQFHWIFGEEFYQYIHGISHKGVGRWTLKNGAGIESGTVFINDFSETRELNFNSDALKDIILLRAIDTGSPDGRIGLYDIRNFSDNNIPIMLGLETSRNLAHVKFDIHPSIGEQLKIIDNVNKRLESYRTAYNSVFLTSFRNSTEFYSRKRISFEVIYKMIVRARNDT